MPALDYTKWKLPKGAKVRLGKGYINDIAYSPDSSRLAVASSIGIWIYDAGTGEEFALFTGHGGTVERLAYSPDGCFIASISDNKTVQLWDAVTGEQKIILNHDDNVTDFLYSPDGSTIITNSQGKVFLWNVVTGEQKATLTECLYNNWFLSVAYSPDGKTIATGSRDGTVLMWEIPFHQHPDINPQEIHGNWRAGWALDVHTLSSRPLPSGRYDTERTEFGELVFQLKYRDDRTKIQPIAEVAAKFVKEKFAVDGHFVLPYITAIIPIPPSDINRDFQPVSVRSQDLKNRCVLLVDDLYDSGTTVTEATKVLYEQGGVQHVLVLTLTRTRTGED